MLRLMTAAILGALIGWLPVETLKPVAALPAHLVQRPQQPGIYRSLRADRSHRRHIT